MSDDNDEFFIGWQGEAPEKTGNYLRILAMAALAVTIGFAIAIPALQQTVDKDAVWESELKEFTGVLVKEPAPILVGDEGAVWFLVNPFKFGFEKEIAEKLHLKRVALKGTLITNDGQVMIEVVPDSVEERGEPAATGNPLGPGTDLGEVALRGEIVDSKCYLGVMNPGNLKPHRACAINCISGGIPPVLLVRDEVGNASYFLLVDTDGEAVNERVLHLVAEPVEVTGRLKQAGSLNVLYADPEKITVLD